MLRTVIKPNPFTPSQPTFTLLRAKVIIFALGEVLELADRRDLESRALGRVGSNPTFPTASCSLGLVSFRKIKPSIFPRKLTGRKGY